LTGVIPFDGEGLIELLYAQVHRDSPLPSSRNARLSPAVDAVIMRGLAKAPAARWETSIAFVDALAAALAVKPEPAMAGAMAQTMVLAPVAAPTVALAAPVVPATAPMPANGHKRSPSATVAVAYRAPNAQPEEKRESRKRAIAVIAGIVLALLLLGVAGYLVAQPKPTLALSAYTVFPGDTIFATASNVPANQVGEIQLLSAIHLYPFRSDANGKVTANLTVPRDIGAGEHTVKLCWASQCHASVTLHVVVPGTAVSPSPGATPSTTPGASPSPTAAPTGNPTPGATPAPQPTSRPTSAPVPTPRPSPVPSPVPSPKPSPIPSPSPSPAPLPRSITLSSTHFGYLTGGTTTVSGSNFNRGSTVTITFVQNGATKATTTTVVNGSGSFAQPLTVPGGLGKLVVGQATISACDPFGCASQVVQVTLV
jgi:hypothetical protein